MDRNNIRQPFLSSSPQSINSSSDSQVQHFSATDADDLALESGYRRSSLRRRGTSASSFGAEAMNMKPRTSPFPSIIVCPTLSTWLFLIAVGTFMALALTKFEEQLGGHELIIKYFSIPLVSVVFTYVHIWLALWMTFYPLEFVGCLQIPSTNVGLGWQGIIPNKALFMAKKSVKLMTTQLVTPQEIFSRLDPELVAKNLSPYLDQVLKGVIDELASKHDPGVWPIMPETIKNEILAHAREESPAVIKLTMEIFKSRIEELFDLEHMVLQKLMSDKQLMNDIFIGCGYKELAFIRDAGAWMGGIFGVIQLAIWIWICDDWYVLPVFGLIVGALTNWIALKMIFSPIRPVQCCCCVLQGLFLKRQDEVAADYGNMIANEMLTGRALLGALLAGPTTDRLLELIKERVIEGCDSWTGYTKPMVEYAMGPERYNQIKYDICQAIIGTLPETFSRLEEYTDEALDLENTLSQRMAALSPEDFESLLHPVFEQDEWKLILVGGILGAIIGMVQEECLGV